MSFIYHRAVFTAQVEPSIQITEKILQIEHNKVKNPGWQEADQLAILQAWPRVDFGSTGTVKQFQLVFRVGLEPGTSGFQVQLPNHYTTLSLELWFLKLQLQLFYS